MGETFFALSGQSSMKSDPPGELMFSRPRPIGVFIGLTLLLIFVWVYQQLEFPAPGGSHDVGRTTIRWVDSARPEVLTEDPSDLREVVAVVWYPAVPGTGVQAGYF